MAKSLNIMKPQGKLSAEDHFFSLNLNLQFSILQRLDFANGVLGIVLARHVHKRALLDIGDLGYRIPAQGKPLEATEATTGELLGFSATAGLSVPRHIQFGFLDLGLTLCKDGTETLLLPETATSGWQSICIQRAETFPQPASASGKSTLNWSSSSP